MHPAVCEDGKEAGGGPTTSLPFQKLTHVRKKRHHRVFEQHTWAGEREREQHSAVKEFVTNKLLPGLVGIPVSFLCSYFERASPMFCPRLDVNFHPITSQDYNSCSQR